MSKASENELGALHGIVARSLAERIASGEATASDYANAIKLLKDNNITCAADENDELAALKNALQGGGAPTETDIAAALEQVEFSGAAN